VAIYLGVDGGGTKTTCTVGDEKSVLATATSGGSNIVRAGEERAREALHAAIRQALSAAGISPADVRRACVGAAGAARPEISDRVRRIVSEVVDGEVQVVGDMEIALHSAFCDGPGVIAIAGTGSIAFGRNNHGRTARAGGWGHAISDEGSGHWIGRTAVAEVLRAHDEGKATMLNDRILSTWNVTLFDELVLTANRIPGPDFAGLLPAVLSAADAGDAVAHRILNNAGTELARLAKTVIERLFPKANTVPVAMSGGVFRTAALVRQVFYNILRAECPVAAVSEVIVEPVQGALDLARKGSSG
jgi:glucosamine kinase